MIQSAFACITEKEISDFKEIVNLQNLQKYGIIKVSKLCTQRDEKISEGIPPRNSRR